MTKEIWKITQSERIVALVALAASLVARGLALLPAYSTDDYVFLFTNAPETSPWLPQGRPAAAVLRYILYRLDALPPGSSLMGSVVLTLMLVWVGLLVCRMWRVERYTVLSGLVVLFIFIPPITAAAITSSS